MKKIKSYTGIWNVEKVLYAINDFTLPFPVTFTQITWFVITEFTIILLGDLPPLSLIEGAFLKYFGIPVALTWFMSQKTFDGKKPYSFLKSMLTYAVRPKVTYAGKAVKLEKEVFSEPVTAVRSVTPLYRAGAQSDHLAGSAVFSYDNIWKPCPYLYWTDRLFIT